MFEGIKDRLLDFIQSKGIAVSTFESKCGLSNGYIKNSKGNFGAKKLDDILNAFPEMSRKWLLYGEGEMLNNGSSPIVGSKADNFPFFDDMPVSAGRVIQYPDVLKHSPSGSIDLPISKGAEFFFPVIGMSMKPTIEEGDIIGVRHIDRYETTNADRLYMIVTNDNERMIKRILRYNKEKETLTLGSDNPNYPDFDLEIESIVDVYKVVLRIQVETL